MDSTLEEQSNHGTDDKISVKSENVNLQQSVKGKKGHKRSDVWAHFDIKNDGTVECIYCGQVYKHQSKSGTSTLRNHIDDLCKKYPYRFQDKRQKTLNFYGNSRNDEVLESVSSGGQLVKFTQKGVREQITKYFILSELPFRHVEDEGFQGIFFSTFDFPSRMTVARDIYRLFLDEKKKLRKELSKH
ncbi:uncharacterized protein LOC111392481 [Olea europaea var. sylvestris]|uniref:uncharacterized protein LOC111392481 n=1 Tax=Olea europaea var. sylvestris TaxID=158386 RepID=UPI000C1D3011|nr:uncharacterized protein LOC111392481 [Olea europaea var. sylvestris]